MKNRVNIPVCSLELLVVKRDEAPVCDSSVFIHCRIYSSLVSCVLTLSTSSSLGSDAETCIKYKGNDINL